MVANFDDILKNYIGSFKKYQRKRICAIIILSSIIINNSSLGSIFIAYEPDHHCKIPSQLHNFNCTEEEMNSYVIPSTQKYGLYDKCLRFERNYSHSVEIRPCESNNFTLGEQVATKECSEWEYNIEESRTSVVTEWDLVCDRKSLAKTTIGVYLAARIFGVFISGWLADRYRYIL